MTVVLHLWAVGDLGSLNVSSERSPVHAYLTGTFHNEVLTREVLFHRKSTVRLFEVLLILLNESEP